MSKTIGERIRNIREEKNYSQQYVGAKLGITQKAYSKLENGESRMSVDQLLKIGEILETSPITILSFEHNNHMLRASNNFESINHLAELYERLLVSKDEEIALLKKMLSL